MLLEMDRRALLGAACVGCAAVVTGCGSGDDTGAPAAAGGSSSTAPASPGSSAATTAAAGTPASPASGAAPLLALADVGVGQSAAATSAQGEHLLVTRTGDATAVAFSARCPHRGCTVAPAGTELTCPCHGSVFKAADGSVVSGPAPRPLSPFAVQVVDGHVLPA